MMTTGRAGAATLFAASMLLALAACTSSAAGKRDAATATHSAATEAAAPVPSVTPSLPRAPLVVIDPGHGGEEVGAANHGVVEKDSNLDMALRLERALAAAGVQSVLTRRDDRRVRAAPSGADAGSFPSTRLDLQARVDIANEAGGDLFVSIHSNGSPDPGQRGVEVWFDPNRGFGETNRALAESALAAVLAELAAYGYPAFDRGIKDDTCFRSRAGRCFPLFLLGPERTTTRADVVRRGFDPEALGFREGEASITTRATAMPGVLVELLFISNPADAAMLRDEGAREAMARGLASALVEMLASQGRLAAE